MTFRSMSGSLMRAVCRAFVMLFVLSAAGVVPIVRAGTTPMLDKEVAGTVVSRLQAVAQRSLTKQIELGKPVLIPLRWNIETEKYARSVIYIGGDFCPFCAAVRWPLIIALLRFGTFKHLHYMLSTSDDVYPDVPTFTFHAAIYSSPYISFTGIEIADRAKRPLDTISAAQAKLFLHYSAPPFASGTGGIPFVYFGGKYMEVDSSFSPAAFKGLSWADIISALESNDGRFLPNVMRTADQYTAAICAMTLNQPSQVCRSSAVRAAVSPLQSAVAMGP